MKLVDGKKAEAAGTNAGTYYMGLKAEDFTATSENYTNIKIEVVDGWLQINPIGTDIIITANSDSKIYDGTALTNSGYTYTEGVLLEGDVLTAEISGSQIDAGTSTNTVVSYKVMRGDLDVTRSYVFGESINGTLTVTPRTVYLTSASAFKKYDGVPLTASEVTISGDGFVTGEGATYTVTGSQTEVGNSENTFTYELMDNTKAENYEITTIPGKLTVTIRDNLHYEVHYYYYDANGNMEENPDELISKDDGVLGEKIEYVAPGTKIYKDQNYMLLRIDTEGKTIQLNEEENIVNVYYALDNVGGKDPEKPGNPDIPDEVPDMYQVEVTYEVVNGTVDVTDTQYVTIYENGDATGKWAAPGTEGAYGTLSEEQIADATANTGYDQTTELWMLNGKATVKPDTESRIAEDRHYVITFEKGMYSYLVVEHYENADGVETATAETKGEAAFEEGIFEVSGVTVTQNKEYEGNNYYLIRVDGHDKLVSADETQNEIHIYYALDNVGGKDPENPENPDIPDGVPDMYQVEVTYEAVNGTVDVTDTQYVTIYENGDATGKWAAPGTEGAYGTLSEEQIADATANTGYDQTTELWMLNGKATVKPDTESRIAEDRHYVITFEKGMYSYLVVEHYENADGVETATAETKGEAAFEEGIFEVSGVTVTQNKEYEGNNYYLIRVDGHDKLVSADETQNEIHIYYALDNVGGKDPENPENPDIPDGVPDMYQVEVTYEVVNGTVDVTDTQYVTIYENGDATGKWATPSEMAWGYLSDEQIADATANTGYDQTTELWTLDGKATVKPDTESQIREDRHYVITFEKGMYNYLVVEHYENADGEEVGKVETPGTAAFEEAILELSGVIVTQNKEYKGDNYTLIRVDGYDKLVSVDETQNEVHIYYTLDNIGGGEDPENPDDIPDKYQLKFTYTSEDPEKGTVTGKTTEVKTFVDEAGNYTEVQPTSPNTMDGHNPVPKANDGYAFAYWTEANQDERDYSLNMTYTLGQKEYTEDTTFVAHFLKDEGGKEDPNQPDGTPDEYQIKFTYVTEDPAHGTFGGVNEVSEVLDRPTNEDGSTNMEKGVSPTVNVTITENGRYRFDHWTDAAGTEYTTEELQKATFTADATFTAHFRYISSSGDGDGSSGSGGGTGPYTPSTGGPGAAIIDDDNVPLAPLPTENNGGNVVIFDDSVPLAPLPKTGQQSSKTPVTMLLTGIFLMFASLRRRKEEKQ